MAREDLFNGYKRGNKGHEKMIDRSKLSNSFEFVVTAGARARQLLAGSTPRVVTGEHKKTTVAQQEVIAKAVEKIPKQEAGN
jgi:DNA-directed RNA polymerase omega subunit